MHVASGSNDKDGTVRGVARRAGVLVVLVLLGASFGGCAGTGALRAEQAEQLKRFCLSVSARRHYPASVTRRFETESPQNFRVGHKGIARGYDVLLKCRP